MAAEHTQQGLDSVGYSLCWRSGLCLSDSLNTCTGGILKKNSSELRIFKLTGSRLQGSNRISSMRTLHWGHRVGPSSSSAAHASKHRWWKTCRQCVRIRMSPCWYASSWHTLQTAEPSRPVDTKTRPCGLPGKSSSAAGAEWGRWVRICSRPIGVHMVSPSSMDTARHVARLAKSGWNRKTLCCSGIRKECTWLGKLAMVGLAVTKQACKLAMAAGHRSGGIGETKIPGGSWAMFKAGRCSVAAMPTAAARVALRARLALARVLLDATTSAGRGLERGGVGAGGWWRAGAAEKTVNGLVLPRPLPLGWLGLVLAGCAVLGGGDLVGLVLARCSAGLGGGNLGDLGLVLARCSAVLGGGELGGLGSRRWIAGGDRDRCLLRLLRLLRDLWVRDPLATAFSARVSATFKARDSKLFILSPKKVQAGKDKVVKDLQWEGRCNLWTQLVYCEPHSASDPF